MLQRERKNGSVIFFSIRFFPLLFSPSSLSLSHPSSFGHLPELSPQLAAADTHSLKHGALNTSSSTPSPSLTASLPNSNSHEKSSKLGVIRSGTCEVDYLKKRGARGSERGRERVREGVSRKFLNEKKKKKTLEGFFSTPGEKKI